MDYFKILTPLVLKNSCTEITWFTTSACNFTCDHCFMRGGLNEDMDELSVDEISRMGDHISGLQRVHLGGGEPFTRGDIHEKAVAVANEWGAEVVCIPTNGYFTDNVVKTIRHFGTRCSKMLRVHFSLCVMGERMDEFTGCKGSFERWESTIREALEVSSEFSNISIVGLVTYGRFNQDHFGEIVDYLLEDIGVDDFSVQLMRRYGDDGDPVDIRGFEKHLNDYFQNTSGQNPFLRAYRELVREYTADYRKSPRYITRCYAGITRVVMSPDGNIYPCEHLGYPNGDNIDEWLIGNIRDHDYDLKRLLSSGKAREITARIKESRCNCEHGIDMALNLICNNSFKLKVAARGTGYLMGGKHG